MGQSYNILVNGHTHVSGYQVVKSPMNGTMSHCLQLSAYKRYDNFADEKGFRDQNMFENAVAIINPRAKRENEKVIIMFDVERAAEYLTWLRQQ
jgi:hypothetical protein